MNTDLLNKIADYIEANPTQFNMDAWAQKGPECGTACCVAGTAFVLGVRPLTDADFVDKSYVRWDHALGKDVVVNEYFIKADVEREIIIEARNVLGLTRDESKDLFTQDGPFWDTAAEHLGFVPENGRGVNLNTITPSFGAQALRALVNGDLELGLDYDYDDDYDSDY